MTTEPSKFVILAWARLLRAHQAALSTVELTLKGAGFPPLAWYDVLLELDRKGSAGMRPFELERELLLPQYGLSRLVDRIVKAGLAERRPAAEDGRGQIIAITAKGAALRSRMWPVYAEAVSAVVGERLTAAEAENLAMLLGRLAGSAKS